MCPNEDERNVSGAAVVLLCLIGIVAAFNIITAPGSFQRLNDYNVQQQQLVNIR